MTGITMFITRMIDEKRRFKRYKDRTAQLPTNYRTAVDGFERYLMVFAPSKGADLQTMLDDLADLFEESAASGTPIRDIVGEDPVEFIETFRRNYPMGQWIVKENERLVRAINASTRSDGAEPTTGPSSTSSTTSRNTGAETAS
jgi:DNA-binding ferritin-like protein (Dps family)